jgi:hypothetical protein
MAITIYTADAVIEIDNDAYEIEFDDEVEFDAEDEFDGEGEDEDGVEYDVDGVAWWYDEESDVVYFYDDEAEDWIEYEGEEDEDEGDE